MKRASISILAAALVGCAAASIHAASLAIDSLAGAITQNEIDSFKAYMAAQVPPPTPWGALNATTHNAWCDGAGGNNLEAMGLMYEATGDINILTNMIYWADTCVSERNDLMAATNGGQRICWDGVIDKIWVAQDLATTNPSTGCETGDAQGHMAYAALLILQNPSLWNQTVPDGDPYGYGTTYFQRATNYVQKCDEANNQYCLKYFVQPGTYLIVDPTNSAWKGLDTPNNRQSMWYVGFGRLAQCHEILGDNPSLATEYENIGKAASGQCINGMAGYHPTTVNGDAVYDWGYYPFDVYPNHLENVGHGAYDMYGVWRAYDRSVYGYTLSTVKPFANALVDVMNIATNSFSGAVDGTGTAQNYMQQQWLWLADLRASVYDVVAQADYVSGRYKSDPYMDAAILWMKNRRQQEFAVSATPDSQTVTAGNGTSYTTTVSPWGGFAGTVSLSVSGLPSGASASFNDSSINLATINAASTNVTLSVSTSSSTAGGTYTLTITGTSGSVSHSTTVSLAVNGSATPDFSISASPPSQTVTAGNGTNYTVNLSSINGFNSSVSLSASGLPSGATASFNPSSLVPPGLATMTVATSASTPAGSSTLTITGTSGSLQHSANATLVVNTPPAAPTGLGATAGNAQVALSWTASSGATSYNVKRATVSGGPYTTIANVSTTSYTDSSVTNGTTYYYVVSAVNSGGESANSSEASATPSAPTAPPAPTGLTATAGNAQVALSWTASSGATSYNVKRATTSGGPYTTITNVSSTSYTDSSVINGTTYYYVVSAVNSAGESANSSEASATPSAPAAPAAPTNLTATTMKQPGHIQLTWTQSSSPNITSNNIYRSTTSGGPYTLVTTLSAATSYT
ncbi:MAG: hypothetical protein KGJ88_13985, partial [Verrucomicrobiota bacterium]|nr:hypothetical protein [Verrucomicrobiota bacterium]